MSALIGRRALLRWVHLILGGALLMPPWLLAQTALGMLHPGGSAAQGAVLQLLAFAVALPIAAVIALVPVVRVLAATAARALCAGAAVEDLATTPSESWSARRRTAAWYVLHLFLGGIVSGLSLAVPPFAAVLLLSGVDVIGNPGRGLVRHALGGHTDLGLVLGPALLLLLLAVNAGAGAWLARSAPALLGPTPAERLAAAEQRAVELARRNRLARELHDSVGHALSAVSIQAAAASRVLGSDPAFAAEALRAIEDTARNAVAELDTVLGLLREEPTTAGDAGPTLAELGGLLEQMRLAGVTVESSDAPELAPELAREVYRIIQEGLTNVLRHAGPVPARLRLELREGWLDVELTNPLGAGRPSRPGGRRGLRGVAERAAALRGSYEAGPQDGSWRLAVRLPTGGEA